MGHGNHGLALIGIFGPSCLVVVSAYCLFASFAHLLMQVSCK